MLTNQAMHGQNQHNGHSKLNLSWVLTKINLSDSKTYIGYAIIWHARPHRLAEMMRKRAIKSRPRYWDTNTIFKIHLSTFHLIWQTHRLTHGTLHDNFTRTIKKAIKSIGRTSTNGIYNGLIYDHQSYK